MNWPDFDASCKDCGGNPHVPAPRQQFPSVPTCPEETKNFPEPFCKDTAGKFYDLTTKKFVIPTVGTTGDLYVCDPTRWIGCNWVALCYTSNQIAILRVIDINISGKFIRVYNGCASDDPIGDNPPAGTTLNAQTVIYAVPPPWCSEKLCKKIKDAIEDNDCACAAVATCLANSDEVCFTVVPVVGADEEVHLFGGILESAKSCLRKVINIITGANGKTLCFPEVPTTTDDPEIIEGNPISKSFAYFTNDGCLKRGADVDATQCGDALDVPDDDRSFDKLIVCKDGVKKLIPPLDSNECIESCKDDANIPRWLVKKKGLTFHPLSGGPRNIHTFASVSTYAATLPDFPTDVCKNGPIYAEFDTAVVTDGEVVIKSTPFAGNQHLVCDCSRSHVDCRKVLVTTSAVTLSLTFVPGTTILAIVWLTGYWY